MQVVVETGDYLLENMGDVAMLQTAVDRLSALWPDAIVRVITHRSDRLEKYCPMALPLPVQWRDTWFNHTYLLPKVVQSLPNILGSKFAGTEFYFKYSKPKTIRPWINKRLMVNGNSDPGTQSFWNIMFDADLVLATGGGYITDSFKKQAILRLATLGMAHRLGKMTAMLGQGLGPIDDKHLFRMARRVLPEMDFIALREGRHGIEVLRSLDATCPEIVVTGDDAIEMAYAARPNLLGEGIGVNLRVAYYSAVGDDFIQELKNALKASAEELNAPLVPVPISFHEFDSDVRSITYLIGGDNGLDVQMRELDTPLRVIGQIARCRVVVTGSYHGAVFALSQGIPVVALARSEYYVKKFDGVAGQFGTGCEVICIKDLETADRIGEAIKRIWLEADQYHEKLLSAAKKQVDFGIAAYRRLRRLVSEKKGVKVDCHPQ